jgi:predicted DNA-binding mobile mystery protein A
MERKARTAAARRAIDDRAARAGVPEPGRPARGWVRAIRDALGMTTRELGARLGVSHTAVASIERSEAAETIKLETLRRAADALDCDLVYALVPRTSLDDTMWRRARALAAADIQRVDHTMSLEQQQLNPDQVAERIEAYAERLIANGRLWRDPTRRA